ncbi:MAG: hypothetical protein JKX81_13055 [Arenicella sp.]|nr:hypothetical protein [Arenicella sp.]
MCHGLEQEHIYGVISYRRPMHRKGYFYKRQYRYDRDNDEYRCQEGDALRYPTTDRNVYRHYKSNPKVCVSCPVRKLI